MSRRTVLVLVSILAHVGVGVGIFASGIWELERLESDYRMAAIGVMTPSQVAGGSPAAMPKPELQKKTIVEKKIVKNVQWEKRIDTNEQAKAVATTAGDDGNGDGDGDGDRKGTGDRITDELCAIPPCLDTATPLPELPKPPVRKVELVAPPTMSALRISGETQIQPSRYVREQIRDSRDRRAAGSVKLCISTSGAITSARMLVSTGYREYDETLLAGVRTWRYRPFLVNGVPTAACSSVSFVYSIK